MNTHFYIAKTPFKTQEGYSLLEVLISLIILSIGILGFAKWQMDSVRLDNDAYFQSVADTQLESMFERLWANKNDYKKEIALWNANNSRLLPQGDGSIRGQNPISISIAWRSPQTGEIKTKKVLFINKP